MEFRIPPILNAERLMDKAYSKASKVQKMGKNREDGFRRTTLSKLKVVSNTLEKTLKRYEKSFPSFDMLPPFYQDIIHITLDTDRLKKSIATVNWARRKIKRTAMENVRDLGSCEGIDEMEVLRKKTYGRVSSFLRQIDSELEYLERARKKLNSLPDIRMDRPTIVVAGSPNVGKSLLMSRLSSGKPKVATYPFTTQEVGIGHLDVDGYVGQVIDTPGILDRPMEERNQIEMQAMKAIEKLADLIIFVFDPTGTCGYPIDAQEALYRDIRDGFENIEMLVVYNKLDLIDEENKEGLYVSALEEENLDILKEILGKKIKYFYREQRIDVCQVD